MKEDINGSQVTKEDIKKFRNYVYLVGRKDGCKLGSVFIKNMDLESVVIDSLVDTYNKMPEEFKGESVYLSVINFLDSERAQEDKVLLKKKQIESLLNCDKAKKIIIDSVFELMPKEFKNENKEEAVIEYLRAIRADIIEV